MDNKEIIYCHRAYKRLSFVERSEYALRFIASSLPFVILVFIYASDITRFMSAHAAELVKRFLGVDTALTIKQYPLVGELHLVSFLGKYPTGLFSAATAFFAAAGIWIFAVYKKIPRSVAMYFEFALAVTLVSSLVFVFFPETFPYNIERFSDFYLSTEIGIWAVIPVVLAMSVMLLPVKIYEMYGLIILMLSYSLLFGFVRYVVFLCLLKKFSYIFMGTMFIAFDPPLDTIYVVGLYSFYISVISSRLKNNLKVWKCT